MTIDTLLGVMFVFGWVGLVALLVRKIPVLKAIDTSKLATIKQQAVKRGLLEARLVRSLYAWGRFIKSRTTPSWLIGKPNSWVASWQNLEDKVKGVIADYSSPDVALADWSVQASQAITRKRWLVAEQWYLKMIQQDPHCLIAYEGLGKIYLEQGEYEQACEVYEFLASRGQFETALAGLVKALKGQGRLSECALKYQELISRVTAIQPRLDLATLFSGMGNNSAAMAIVKHTLAREPNNPKVLDFFIELSIVDKQPIEAQTALDILRQVNPDNKKIPELAKAIEKLVRQTKPKAVMLRRKAKTVNQ